MHIPEDPVFRLADRVIEILTYENDKATDENYYLAASEKIRNSMENPDCISYVLIHGIIRASALKMLRTQPDPKAFIRESSSRDLFEKLLPALDQCLREMGNNDG